MSAKVKLPPELANLLRSELETAIYEAALHRDDELIAKRRIIDKWAEMDIAAELGWERSTVSKHIPYILNEVKRVANRITKLKESGINPAPFALSISLSLRNPFPFLCNSQCFEYFASRKTTHQRANNPAYD